MKIDTDKRTIRVDRPTAPGITTYKYEMNLTEDEILELLGSTVTLVLKDEKVADIKQD